MREVGEKLEKGKKCERKEGEGDREMRDEEQGEK